MRRYESPSSINMYRRCGIQYLRRYINGERIPPGFALVVGSGVHGAQELDMRTVLGGQPLPSLEEAQNAASERVKREVEANGLLLSEDEQEQGLDAGAAVDEAVSLTEVYHVGIAPQVVPVSIERKWTVPLDGFPFSLTGFIDVQDRERRVRDLKNVSKRQDPRASFQLDCYALAVKVEDGAFPADIGFDMVLKQKRPSAETAWAGLTPAEFDRKAARVVDVVDSVARGLESEVYLPAEDGAWCCSPKWCGYWSTCNYRQG